MTLVDAPLYERLGGESTVDAVVQDFYRRVLGDAALAKLFADVSMPRQRRMLAAFVSEATGGPSVYRGRDAVEAHSDVRITANRMRKMVGHLADALGDHDIDAGLVDETIDAITPIADAIVQASTTTRTTTPTTSSNRSSTSTTPTKKKAGTRSRSTRSTSGQTKARPPRPATTSATPHTKETPMASNNGRTAAIDQPETDTSDEKILDELFADFDGDHSVLVDMKGQLAAIDKSQAVISFEMDGTIIDANDNFLGALGYTRDEIVGQHHRIFAEPEYAASPEYAAFWAKLGRGEFDAGEYKRIGKGGKEVWIQASYNPILDDQGQPFKVVKYATDITAQKLRNADYEGQLAAIDKSQAVISFELDGTIIDANDNFLGAVGYSRDEVVGQHHRIFAEPGYAASPEYTEFWAKLGRGEFDAGEYKRLGKGGTEIWIQASYNPILDASGRPFKVVKYATDITDQVKNKRRLEAGVDEILSVVTAAADGDLTGEIQTEGDDPIGQMGVGVAKLLSDLRESIASIGRNSEALAAAAEELQVVSEQMGANAAETSSQVSLVSEGSVEVSQNIETVSTGAEEMSASIKEIAKNASDAAKVAEQAVEAATTTNSTVEKLGESSAEIGQIVKVITGIAQQTNLLALNATIEAARAGEAGKGFAVVANEVKELAKETAKATEDISQKIEMIQGDTGRSVDAISEIAEIINQISEYQTTIASAVEEQAATTSDIARSVTDASRGSTEITSNMQAVAAAAESTSSGAADSQRAATELAQMAAELQTLVGRFTY